MEKASWECRVKSLLLFMQVRSLVGHETLGLAA